MNAKDAGRSWEILESRSAGKIGGSVSAKECTVTFEFLSGGCGNH
jgi:hypothetical protein